ncbi:pyrroline-5-carboxylate reductase [Clostridium sp. CX1]|uniref:pyrroline-5-carboxylate reductase n=1 Tax=Clostridium sp. CX1 TaxID=2978346 RepID=UPI0021C178AC|nr:pyrroline-5-carboxylate reductase [Clostridium sp. CX1]MCT8978514.1 pyrroline-5-carboxylate reductase [Clostridium sp. CX1]
MERLGKKVGFIGGGQMGEAIIKGMINSGLCSAEEIYVMDILDSRIKYLKEQLNITHGTSNREQGYIDLVKNCDVIILAIKPQVLKEVLESIKDCPWREEQVVISIVGGARTAAMETYLKDIPVVRVIPNTPMLVNVGASGLALGKNAKKQHGDLALQIFKALGVAYLVPENLIDPITSVSGCGPAYVYMFIEAMADGGVEMGLTREMAQTLAAQTVMGAAKMVLDSGDHPGLLKDKVCSPGGATIAGVRALEQGGFRGTVMNAVEAGKVRMEEVGKKAE